VAENKLLDAGKSQELRAKSGELKPQAKSGGRRSRGRRESCGRCGVREDGAESPERRAESQSVKRLRAKSQ
jgi:hypothetical protein